MSGASGFVGSNVLRYLLLKTDWRFTLISSWRHRGSPLRLVDNIDRTRIAVVTHDLRGPIPEFGVTFDYILNFASDSHVDRSIEDPVATIENNVSSTLSMLEYARHHRPRAFLQFSTDEVYGAAPFRETTADSIEEWSAPVLPSNPYAASKAAQEAIGISYWRTYRVPVIITNSNNIVGPRQDTEKFVPKIIHLVRLGVEVPIHVGPDGQPGVRYYNPVVNVASAVRFVLRRAQPFVNGWPERYNLPGGERRSNLELAEEIARIMGRDLQYRLVEGSATRPGYDDEYAHLEGRLTNMGWKPPSTLNACLRQVVG
jgi:dTDP-glucose 4,6-dehydratase